MVDSSQGAGKCTRPPCREVAYAYAYAWRTVWPFRPLRRPSSTERGRQRDRKTGRTIARSLPPGHTSKISRRPERLLLSYIQRGCGPAQSACWCFEVPRHLPSFFVFSCTSFWYRTRSYFVRIWLLVCYAATQLATKLQQRCIQVVCVCVCVLLCFVDPILGKSRSRCHSLNQGTWGDRIPHPPP